ncbi:hypothetical protein FBU30_001487 [Linnemannia zychae]|nr:hypothetical protein FBU30_001487 [Linnemannia zychae]
MGHLTRLPPECFQRIIEIIAYTTNRSTLSTLLTIICVNKYFAITALPFLYKSPFRRIALDAQRGPRTKALIQTLLGSILVTDLHPAVTLEFGTNISISSFGMLDYVKNLDLKPAAFSSCISEKNMVEENNADYVKQRMNRLPEPYINGLFERCILPWQCHRAVAYQELMWTLSNPILEQLESLCIPLSDIHRYHEVIGRLSRLEEVFFVLDDIYDRRIRTSYPSVLGLRHNKAMQDIILFVEEHTRLFKGCLKITNGVNPDLFRYVNNSIDQETENKLCSLLPPLQHLTSFSHNNWTHFMKHPMETDLSKVEHIWGIRVEQWQHSIQENLQILQRCHSLRRLDLVSVGRGTFSWAAQMRKRLKTAGSGLNSNLNGTSGTSLLKNPMVLSNHQGLAPLERVRLLGYSTMSDEADDIAFAFSETLQHLIVVALVGSGQYQTIYFGKGWVDLPCLTEIDLTGHQHRIVIDPLLLAHCPNIIRARIEDSTSEYRCADINPCYSANLPRLVSMTLQGWSALTFHPETLRSANNIEFLRLHPYNPKRLGRYIPPIDELDRSYGAADTLEAKITEDKEASTYDPRPVRPYWSWDWDLPKLTFLDLTGEFAFRFQFRLLMGCPSLTRLYLNIRTDDRQHTRALSLADFNISPDTNGLTNVLQGNILRKPRSTKIVVRSLTTLLLGGSWVLDDSLIENLLHGMFPRLHEVIMHETTGYTLRALIDLIRNKVKHVILMETRLSPPSKEECVELGVYPRKGRAKDMKVAFPYKLYFGSLECLLLRDPAVLAEELSQGG